MSRIKQERGANHIRELLSERGIDLASRQMTLAGNQLWLVFERNGRQAGVDTASGIWLRESAAHDWRCVAMPHTSSGAIMAADFLCQG
jgi:hypothetical protein